MSILHSLLDCLSGHHLQMKLRNHHRPYVLQHVPSTPTLTNCLSFPRYPVTEKQLRFIV